MLSKRTNKIIIFALLLYLIFITYTTLSVIHSELRPGIKISSDSFIYMFELVQPFSIFGAASGIVALLLFPMMGSFVPIFIKNNNELTNVIQRIGYNTFLKRAAKQTFLIGMLFSLITEIYTIILINWNYAPIAFTKNSLYLRQEVNAFSTDSLVQLLAFLLTSALGWGIFSVLVFACGLYIKKNPIYLVSGAVLGLFLLLLPSFYGTTNYFLYIVANITEVITLTTPGMVNLFSSQAPGGIWLMWILSAAFYSFLATILMIFWKKQQERGK